MRMFEMFNRRVGMTVFGTDGRDTLYGGHGNDTIYAGEGNDIVIGGDGDDRIYADSGPAGYNNYWGYDKAYGGNGGDVIDYSHALERVEIYGDAEKQAYADRDGNDTIYGGRGSDIIVGGGGNDTIYGGDGNDIIVTDYGAETKNGYYGQNTVYGGHGQDTVIVSGWDRIVIYKGDSNPVDGQQDIISQFQHTHAVLDLPGDADASNYAEVKIAAKGFDAALHMANSMLATKDYVFITDGEDGYVFADTDFDGRADIGVTIAMLTSTDQFSHYMIT